MALPPDSQTTPTGWLNVDELNALCLAVGITDAHNRAVAISIAMAESHGNPRARHVNSDRFHSIDYGLWQINGHWHPTYDTSKLLEPGYNASAMYDISAGGTSWAAWSTYSSGRYKSHMAAAEAAAARNVTAGAGGGLGGLGDFFKGVFGGASSVAGDAFDAAKAAGDAQLAFDRAAFSSVPKALQSLFSNWQRDVLGLLLGGVFVAGGLAVLAIGLGQLSHVDPADALDKASTAATAAALVA